MTTKTTTTARKRTTIDPDAPDVHRAAARVIEGEQGVNANTLRTRRFRARQRGEQETAAPEPKQATEISVTPGDVESAAQVGGVVWDIVGPMFRLRPLDDSQRERLGTALAPLIAKYMPILGNWQYEVAALLTVMALARECHVPRAPEPEEAATVENDAQPPEKIVNGGSGVPISGRREKAPRSVDGAASA